ncbi:hypothetical protein G5I_13874 [Acromyrmex echinatior]|uniref:Uncharacterized protein n=1 Tax=Acromyrmex echinatior TaxID=103372 RepID=F4X669_ACREC|nr:hypothetical protein G5I_13874 [Acromyrmex echinatior]
MKNSDEPPAKRLKIKEEKIINSDEPPAKRLKIKEEKKEDDVLAEDNVLGDEGVLFDENILDEEEEKQEEEEEEEKDDDNEEEIIYINDLPFNFNNVSVEECIEYDGTSPLTKRRITVSHSRRSGGGGGEVKGRRGRGGGDGGVQNYNFRGYTSVNGGSSIGPDTKTSIHAVLDYDNDFDDYYDDEDHDIPINTHVTPIQGPIFLKNNTVPVIPLYSYPQLNNGTFVQIPRFSAMPKNRDRGSHVGIVTPEARNDMTSHIFTIKQIITKWHAINFVVIFHAYKFGYLSWCGAVTHKHELMSVCSLAVRRRKRSQNMFKKKSYALFFKLDTFLSGISPCCTESSCLPIAIHSDKHSAKKFFSDFVKKFHGMGHIWKNTSSSERSLNLSPLNATIVFPTLSIRIAPDTDEMLLKTTDLIKIRVTPLADSTVTERIRERSLLLNDLEEYINSDKRSRIHSATVVSAERSYMGDPKVWKRPNDCGGMHFGEKSFRQKS